MDVRGRPRRRPRGRLEAREATVRLYQVLAGADPEDRALFVIRYVEKMELAEIVAIKGWSLSKTKRRLARLTRRITARMKRDQPCDRRR